MPPRQIFWNKFFVKISLRWVLRKTTKLFMKSLYFDVRSLRIAWIDALIRLIQLLHLLVGSKVNHGNLSQLWPRATICATPMATVLRTTDAGFQASATTCIAALLTLTLHSAFETYGLLTSKLVDTDDIFWCVRQDRFPGVRQNQVNDVQLRAWYPIRKHSPLGLEFEFGVDAIIQLKNLGICTVHIEWPTSFWRNMICNYITLIKCFVMHWTWIYQYPARCLFLLMTLYFQKGLLSFSSTFEY